MHRAQLRDAARSSKFYFRKDVFPPGHTSPTASTASSSGNSSPTNCSDCGGIRKKETKLRNCFPALPRPANDEYRGPVEEEYREMSMNKIMNGTVRDHNFATFSHILMSSSLLEMWCISGPVGPRQCLRGHIGCRPGKQR
jgi:glutamate--cysteine ligase catalytic subunit